jgi:hypothetical protein
MRRPYVIREPVRVVASLIGVAAIVALVHQGGELASRVYNPPGI